MMAAEEKCPFDFNFNPATFKVGDVVSYRVPSLGDFPFMGTLLTVQDDYVELSSDPNDPSATMKASREARPVVMEVKPG